MKEISYKDPYEIKPVIIAIEEDDTEGLEEVIAFLNEDARLTQNRERKERYHNQYHLDALVYDGEDYASDEDIEAQNIKKDTENIIDDWLHENLTGAQYRRFNLYMEGISIREIARLEGANYSSVNESIKAAQKKLKKLYKYSQSELPF